MKKYTQIFTILLLALVGTNISISSGDHENVAEFGEEFELRGEEGEELELKSEEDKSKLTFDAPPSPPSPTHPSP